MGVWVEALNYSASYLLTDRIGGLAASSAWMSGPPLIGDEDAGGVASPESSSGIAFSHPFPEYTGAHTWIFSHLFTPDKPHFPARFYVPERSKNIGYSTCQKFVGNYWSKQWIIEIQAKYFQKKGQNIFTETRTCSSWLLENFWGFLKFCPNFFDPMVRSKNFFANFF